MEGDFRNTLIIISAVVIAVIFIHGFITIRKNKNPYKLKTKNEKLEPIERGFDGSGFDQDGVSKPRVVENTPPPTDDANKKAESEKIEPVISNENLNHQENDVLPIPKALTKTDTSKISPDGKQKTIEETAIKAEKQSQEVDISLTDSGINNLKAEAQVKSMDIGDELSDFDYNSTSSNDLFDEPQLAEEFVKAEHIEKQAPLYDTPITQPKPEIKKTAASVKATKPKTAKKKSSLTKKEAIKRNQIELNFGDPVDTNDMPSMSAIDDAEKVEKQKKLEPLEPEVLVVSIVMPEGQVISGSELLPTLLTLGLRYGDMDIFHRHQDNAGNGKVTFSVANIMNPGTFDLDSLETFTTCGLTFFMTLPNAGDAFEVFEHMMGAAKQISIEFGAQLLDDKRSVMTKQTEQHYTSKIREFERKNRIALSEIN